MIDALDRIRHGTQRRIILRIHRDDLRARASQPLSFLTQLRPANLTRMMLEVHDQRALCCRLSTSEGLRRQSDTRPVEGPWGAVVRRVYRAADEILRIDRHTSRRA